MSALSEIRYRLRALFGHETMDHDLSDELRFHLEHETAKLVAQGMAPAEAARRARIALGGMDRITEDTRDARGINLIENLLQDLRYAWRGIRTRPAFASAIILALALGLGANAAMFGIVDRLLFRPPSFITSPERVHRVYLSWHMENEDRTDRVIEYTRYADLAQWTTSFDKMAVVGYRTAAIGVGENVRELTIAAMSATMFDLFGARPVKGRFFTAAEDHTPIGEPVAVLGYGFWQSHFGGRDDVIGQTLQVGPAVLTIIGVAPRDFVGITDDRAPALFVPVTTVAGARNQTYFTTYHWSWLEMFARRKEGVSLARADADLTTAYRRSWEVERTQEKLPTLEQSKPRAMAGSIHLSRGPNASADSRVVTWVMGVAVIVLLVACANVANLLLARAVARRREIAMRVALGVSRPRLIQQLATESVVLATLGGGAGLVIAAVGGRLLQTLFASDGESSSVIADGRTIFFIAFATMLVALLTGLAPAVHALRADVNTALKGGSSAAGRRRSHTGTALLLFQGALSVVLLVGAGLFMRSLSNVRAIHLGYDVDPIVFLSAEMRGSHLKPDEQMALNQRLLEAVAATPGVTAATLTTSVPFWSNESRGAPVVQGKDSLAKVGRFLLQAGSPSYFKTVGTRVLKGRGFETTDQANTTPVAVISERMASAIWPGEDALGKQFRFSDPKDPWITVVGVAENMHGRLIRSTDEIWIYVPMTQAGGEAQYPQIFARITGRPQDYLDLMRKRLQPMLPGTAYLNAVPLKNMVTGTQRAWQFGATMFMVFGGLALLLAAIGLYSVIAYAVAQRTRELGVRIALGASAGNVVRMVVGQGVVFALSGIAIGSAIALASGKWVEPLLFNQSAKDPTVFVIVGGVLLIVAVAASAKPAFRAMRVDPSEVLRSD